MPEEVMTKRADLSKNTKARQTAYRDFFRANIDIMTIMPIQKATQKDRVLGDVRFKDDVEQVSQRNTLPLSSGGDRCSVEYYKQWG